MLGIELLPLPLQAAMGAAMNLISHSVEISHSLEVPAKNIVMEGTKGKVTLTPPFSEQLGYRPIPLLLISNKWRDGQVYTVYYERFFGKPHFASVISTIAKQKNDRGIAMYMCI
jgi:hypothetical protein